MRIWKRIMRLAGDRRHARTRQRAERGMTLIEIMIVLAIIALIMGTIGASVFGAWKRGQVKTAKIAVTEIASAAQQYMMDNSNNCPGSIDDIVAKGFLKKKAYKDPWNKEFLFKCPGVGDPDGVDISSGGPNKTEGDADDIKSWE